MDTVIGWGFYLLLVFGGLASIVATTVFAYRRLCAHGVSRAALVVATVAVAGPPSWVCGSWPTCTSSVWASSDCSAG
jgi:uncharacterized membrane protein YhaH (DUF805 family)